MRREQTKWETEGVIELKTEVETERRQKRDKKGRTGGDEGSEPVQGTNRGRQTEGKLPE